VDFWIAVLAVVGVLGAGVLAGVVIGIVLSIGWLVYTSATPALSELGRQPGTSAFRSLEEAPDLERLPHLLVVRFDSGLTFLTAEVLADGVEERVGARRAVVIDFAGVNVIDSQGSGQLGLLVAHAQREGWSLRLARVRPGVRAVLDADGVLSRLGPDRLHGNVDEAVRAQEMATVAIEESR